MMRCYVVLSASTAERRCSAYVACPAVMYDDLLLELGLKMTLILGRKIVISRPKTTQIQVIFQTQKITMFVVTLTRA